ncbi:MAG: hypothetical protein M1823_002881 [Watsoniomyces obsoletus]|nr:MAG: hypothetical protein M1823_002881 [Watsoniomyces obsoletus]
MASSQSNSQSRGYTQEYIARVRYSNALPPPDMPPKLLEIPNPGSSRWLHPNFLNEMIRKLEPNMEADAELGVAIDLIGVPGVFNGDESVMNLPEVSPEPHPDDVALLQAFEQMDGEDDEDAPTHRNGKNSSMPTNSAFLRRPPDRPSGPPTSTPPRATRNVPTSEGAKKSAVDRSPKTLEAIRKALVDIFNFVNAEGTTTAGQEKDIDVSPPTTWTAKQRNAWLNPQHPSREGVRPVGHFPIKPDLDGFPETGGYMVMKFLSNPGRSGQYRDETLDSGILRPLSLRPELESAHRAAIAAANADPTKHMPSMPPFDYELHLPASVQATHNIQRKLDPNDPDHDDPALYTHKTYGVDHSPTFRFKRQRAYETVQTFGNLNRGYDEVALVFKGVSPNRRNGHGGGGSSNNSSQNSNHIGPMAAYYYPVVQRLHIRPRRAAVVHASMLGQKALAGEAETAGEIIDVLEVVVQKPTHESDARRLQIRAQVDPTVGGQLLLEASERKDDDDDDGVAKQAGGEGRGDVDVLPSVEVDTPVPTHEEE